MCSPAHAVDGWSRARVGLGRGFPPAHGVDGSSTRMGEALRVRTCGSVCGGV